MEIKVEEKSVSNELSTKPANKSKRMYVVVGFFVILLISAVLLLMQINSLNKQISELEKTQLPQKIFTSYEDCIDNGGVLLNTINGQFNACLGGSEAIIDAITQNQAFLQYSAQNLPRIDAGYLLQPNEKLNDVENSINASPDLVEFLAQSYSGCNSDLTNVNEGYYKIVKEVKGRYAMLNYGCKYDQSALEGKYYMIAIRLADGWRLISPTNNFDENGVPSCLMVDMFVVSRELSEQCYENTGYNNGSLKNVDYP